MTTPVELVQGVELFRESLQHQQHAFLGALIGGGISLIGGLLGRKDAKKKDKKAKKEADIANKKAEEENKKAEERAEKASKTPVITKTASKVDLKGLVTAAEKAGFNPVTFLNSGALSAFTSTTSKTTGSNAGALTNVGYIPPTFAPQTAPSTGSVIAGALGTAFNIAREDGLFQAKPSVSSFPSAPKPGWAQAMPQMFSPASSNFVTRATMSSKNKTSPVDGRPLTPSVETPTMTNPHTDWYVDPTVPDAEMLESRYGDSELLSTAGFVHRGYADLVYNLTGSTSAGRGKVYDWMWQKATGALKAGVRMANHGNAFEAIANQTGSSTGKLSSRNGGGGW